MRLGIRHALLKMLEGTVPPLGDYIHTMPPEIPLDPTNPSSAHIANG
jgi:hypothetical protein